MNVRPRARFRLSRDEVRAGATGGASATDPRSEIQRVAEEHAPEGGYGETAFHDQDATVYWVSADWSSSDEVEAAHAAFMEIDGVNGVVGDAESALPDGEGWEQVWPVRGSQEAYERVLAVARRPLGLSFAALVPASAHYRPSTVPDQDCGTCAYFDGHSCTKFEGHPTVQADMVCDEWTGNQSKPVESDEGS